VAGDRGSSVYTAYVKEQIESQDARKSSIEQRGLAVISTSGTLVSLLFGLVAVLTGAEDYKLPGGAEPWIYAALVAFVLAAVTGILCNLPLFYRGVKAGKLGEALKAQWQDEAGKAEREVTVTNIDVLTQATRLNSIKGIILIVAISLEVLAVAFLAVAVRAILVA
jgi:hypothetical protein